MLCSYRSPVGGLKHILVGIQWKVLKICPMMSLRTDILSWKWVNVNEKGEMLHIVFLFE